MENCIGRYVYNKETVDCPVKWRCRDYAIRGGDKRKKSKPSFVEMKDDIFIPSCYISAFEKTDHR